MSDWIDKEIARRNAGHRRALDQGQHAAINARHYPGTRQLCAICDQPTGRCEEDSMYRDGQPVCREHWSGEDT